MVSSDDPGYIALREGVAWIDLTGRGEIRVTGEDRARLLHAMATNHVAQLEPGQGCYAFFLDAQGHILADVHFLCFPNHFLLDTEPETRGRILEHLDRYIIADDVALEDVTDQTIVLGVEGPNSEKALSKAGAPVPDLPYAHAPWGSWVVARITSTGAPGFRIFAPLGRSFPRGRSVGERADLVRQLESAGAVAAGAEASRTVRLEIGKPRYGEDVTEKHLPHETQLLHAVHFNKGCYLGQEIVERVRSRGLVHRLLVPLRVAAGEAPAPGTPILAEGKEIGEITSATVSPPAGTVVALGYVRREHATGQAQLTASGAPVEIRAPKPAA